VFVVLANWIPLWFPEIATPAGPAFGWSMLALGLAMSLLFLDAMRQYESPGHSMESLGAATLGLAYVAVFISATVQLRWVHGGELFYVPLASLVVISKCGDTAAYFAGHAIGGAKLSPRLSPGKTVAGAVGALIGGMLGGWAWLHFGIQHLTSHAPGPWPALLLYGLVLSVSGMAGDLAESLIKRDVQRKDASALLPGFGGLLDIVDSVFFSGPIAVVLWTVLPLIHPKP
jgi:phosphatidate cytidylyltransferase